MWILCNLLRLQFHLIMSHHRHSHPRRSMISIVFHKIQVKGCPFKAMLLMIKMQFKEHIFLKVHCNHLHIIFQKEKLGIEIVNSILYGLQHHWLEYSIKKDSVFCFICYLFKDNKCKGKCSKITNVRARGQIHLLQMVGEIGI